MNNNPKVSVIMSVYNTKNKDRLEKSINSILNQTYKNFEFIIYNDGSTNECFKWTKEICQKDNRCILIDCKENKGLAFALNECIRKSSGDLIARMDDDDESLNTRLEKQVETFIQASDIGVVNCNINVFDEDGVYGERIYKEDLEVKDFLMENPIVHPAVMMKKECLEKVNGYRDIDMTFRNEDYDLFLRMLHEGIKMYTIQEKLFNFREDKDSYKRRMFKYRINEYRVKYENFKKLGLLPKYYILCLKPIVVGLIPVFIMKRIRNRGEKS